MFCTGNADEELACGPFESIKQAKKGEISAFSDPPFKKHDVCLLTHSLKKKSQCSHASFYTIICKSVVYSLLTGLHSTVDSITARLNISCLVKYRFETLKLSVYLVLALGLIN